MSKILPSGVRLGAPLVETIRDPEFLQLLQLVSSTRQVSTCRALSIVPGRVFNVTAAPMPGGASLLVLHDLTEIERVEKTRRDFIANVSHELRTPLTSIQGYAETLLDSAYDENVREFLEVIRKNAARMTRITEDLLVLAKVESGENKPNLQPLSASELLYDAEQYFHEHQSDSGLTLNVCSNALKLVHADRDAIFQVFTNLIDNACKYASEGGRIEIGALDIAGYVEFSVRDFGPGIPSEHLPRLFERFYRVEKARSRETGGTGLGLSIAKHIVRVHGGQIRAQSELNHGSTFLFTLPEARQ
jgi:two-component system phosphate regulon sensor histidine kinase PhoR